MEAKIFYHDGKLFKEIECESVVNYHDNMSELVVNGGFGNVRTNLPILVKGVRENWNHMLEGQQEYFDITMIISSTSNIQWSGANCLVEDTKSVSFYHSGFWHTIIGSYFIENIENIENNIFKL